ncbi:MAG: F0F1-type ATP synthase epsilon subunit [Candidatus Omnitrophota bacterium]|jgi:F0F1-type ATP synthase epsilon subunit
MFDLLVVSPKRVIFDEAVEKVRLDGDQSEYEFLSFHARTMGKLRQGNVIIDEKHTIPIKSGVVRFIDNQCTILCEEMVGYAPREKD